MCNSPFHSSRKVTKVLHETEAKVDLAKFRELEIVIMRKKLISMSIISTSLTVSRQPSPRFHVQAWLSFRSCETDYFTVEAFCA